MHVDIDLIMLADCRISGYPDEYIHIFAGYLNKLEFYKTEIIKGKELNEDQQKAVDAFDAVVASLELCRDFSTQIENVIVEHSKFLKIQQKKQQEEKGHHEFERIKQMLKIQDVLKRISLPEIRADFLSGTNGAIQVKDEQLKQLDEVSKLVTPPIGPKREKNNAGFKVQINTAAENMICFLDGKNKPAATGTTYREMKNLTKNQIPNGTAVPGEVLPVKVKAKTNSRVASSAVKVPPKPSTASATSPSTAILSPISPNIVVSDPNTNCLPSSPLKTSLQDTTLNSVVKSKRREIHSAPEGPPPGISTPSVMPENATSNLIASIHPQIRTGVGATANSTSLSQNNTFFNATQNQPTPQTSSRISIDINDLVTSGSFNFLQESQVVGPDSSSQAAVYVDPAVVSFCKIGDVGGSSSIQPPSISIPIKEEKKPYIEPSTSWAAQEDTDGWGGLDNSPTPVNGNDGGWVESSTWGEPCEIKSQHNTLQDIVDDKRASGYRGVFVCVWENVYVDKYSI
ncbi:Caprin-2 [Armadillidium nasatum]|uniref:Caprin-2 n=1 Tax=Armadillidium nasatum TaxID=96803 RepID=A0A5N5TNR9_9CRUS|nr:Caprin-2 [Armadillidium nasatum]